MSKAIHPTKKTFPHRSLVIMTSASIMLAACGGGGSSDSSGTQAAATSKQSSASLNTLVNTSAIATGNANCPAGGILVQSGVDANGNGVLDPSEVTSSQYVCNGTSGTSGKQGLSSLITSTALSTSNTNCPYGGTEIQTGLDQNGDGVLQASEVSNTRYICNGAPGTASGTTGATGATGAAGTNGLNSLILMVSEPAGANCTSGGTKITSGLDLNSDGILEASEVTSTRYVCNGAAGSTGTAGATGATGATGAAGTGALITSVALGTGNATCANGGTEILTGLNNDGTGTLLTGGAPNTNNVTGTSYICNGAPGTAGANGTNGTNGTNGSNGSNGTNGSNGSNGVGVLIQSVSLSVGDATCPYGGTAILTGLNTDGTGVLISGSTLNAANSASISYICNGNPAGLTWVNVTGSTAVQTSSNLGYLADYAGNAITFTLPTSPSVGDIIRIRGGSSNWSIAQNAGQSINLSGLTAYSGRSLVHTQTGNTSLYGIEAGAASAASADGSHVVVVGDNGQGNGDIWTSSNYGATWINQTSSGSAPNQSWDAVASSTDGSKLVAVAHGADIWTSANYGVTWTNQTSSSAAHGKDWRGVASSADGTHLAAVVANGDIWTSTNSGATWVNQTTGTSASGKGWTQIASSYDGSHLVAVPEYGDIWTSSNYGATWTDQTPSGSAHNQWWGSAASSSDGQYLIVGGSSIEGGNIWISSNYGASWTNMSTVVAAMSGYYWTAVAISADGSHLVAQEPDLGVWTSTDYGATWTQQTATNSISPQAMSMSANGQYLYVMDSQADFYTYSLTTNYAGTTTPGTGGSLSGSVSDTVELQYLGNGMFSVLSYTGTDLIAN